MDTYKGITHPHGMLVCTRGSCDIEAANDRGDEHPHHEHGEILSAANSGAVPKCNRMSLAVSYHVRKYIVNRKTTHRHSCFLISSSFNPSIRVELRRIGKDALDAMNTP